MRSFAMLQYLMVDSLSLISYRKGKELSINELSSNLYEQLHHANQGVPELYFNNEITDWLKIPGAESKANNLCEVLVKLLPSYVKTFFYEEDGFVYLRTSKANDWQLTARLLSPLLMTSAFLYYKHQANVKNNADVRDIILKNTKHTALPNIQHDTINLYGESPLRDMHYHLNGTMEADRAVLNLMRNPKRILGDPEKTEDSIIQSFGYVSRYDVNIDISRLCYLESLLSEAVFRQGDISKEDILRCISTCDFRYTRDNAITSKYFRIENEITDLQFEGLLIHKTLRSLHTEVKERKESIAMALHVFLLLYGRLRSFAVMQQGDKGLHGFNRYLKYGMRSDDDAISAENFCQLVGNTSHTVEYLDVRMGYFPEKQANLKRIEASLAGHYPSIAHVFLIRKVADVTKRGVRNAVLRRSLTNDIVPTLLRDDIKDFYCAVDVAGRDYEVRPDVFAPYFEKLREAGYNRFTYHAGEDFYHILGGLRAIYEAIHFLKLDHGCRIGHACAAGVAPFLWSNTLGGEIRMKRGEYLDDLIFVRRFINDHAVSIPMKNKRLIDSRIKELAQKVYGRTCSIHDLTEAWGLRSSIPETYLAKPVKSSAEQLLCDYHNNRTNYEERITVKCYEVLNETHIVRIQKALLSYIALKDIAIETMPTSNVFIGMHHSFHSYHLKQWIYWKYYKKFKVDMPAIVIGSDEPGILCTNIMAEYGNISNMLESADDMLLSKSKIPMMLRQFVEDAEKYKFV